MPPQPSQCWRSAPWLPLMVHRQALPLAPSPPALQQAADPQHLLVAAVPFSEAAGRRVVLVYDSASEGPPNAVATRLTTGVEDGLEVQASSLC